MNNTITNLFGIQYPIIQAGMVWNSGWELASASSNSGILGLIGAGSMYPDVLRKHIQKCTLATDKPFGVNVPLLYPNIEEIMQIIVEEDVKIVFTSAGNPSAWAQWLKNHGITVVHVVSSVKFALKAEACGVDAIVADHELQPETREKWDEINRRVSDWNVNIIDKTEPLGDAKEWDGYPNKYEKFGIIPIKEIT